MSTDEERTRQQAAIVLLNASVTTCCVCFGAYVLRCALNEADTVLFEGLDYKRIAKVSIFSVLPLVIPVRNVLIVYKYI